MSNEGSARTVVCAEHGLRYDPKESAGCVICRRKAPSEASQAVSASLQPKATASSPLTVTSKEVTIPTTSSSMGDDESTMSRLSGFVRERKVLFRGVVAAGLIALVVATLALGKSEPRVASGAGSEASEPPVARYVRTMWALEDSLPLQELRAATSGLADQARMGTIDVEDRRTKLRSYLTKLDAQREQFSNTDAPDEARALRGLMLDWYDRAHSQAEVTFEQLRQHEEIARLVERKKAITSREDAAELAQEFKSAEGRVRSTVERSRELLKDARSISLKKREEEERLLREQHLSIHRGQGAESPSNRAGSEANASDVWCQSILEMGGTMEDCKAATR